MELMAKVLDSGCVSGCRAAASTQGHSRRRHAAARAPAPSGVVADVIQAIDGPFTLTACSTDDDYVEQFEKRDIGDQLWRLRERIVEARDRRASRNWRATPRRKID